MAPSILELSSTQAAEAAAVLARAFVDNPGVRAVLGRYATEQRRVHFERISRGFVAAARRYGLATALLEDDRIAGVTLVYPPGAYPVPVLGQLLMAKEIAMSNPRTAWNFARVAAHLQRVHLRTPHYYLFMIGVDPPMQSKGYGGRLLSHLNEIADQAHSECYLETEKLESVGLYEHFGYQVVRDDILRSVGNLRIWTMRRAPQL